MSKLSSYKTLCALMLMLVMAMSSIPVLAQSQAGSGQIVGTVTDPQKAAIAGATIKAVNSATGLTSSATSNDSGSFQILLLPPGKYKVTIEASGFSKINADVEVTVGRAADLNVELKTGGVEESITVTAGAVQVQTTRSEADAVINERAIENLPINGRRFQDFVTLTPTAQVDPQRGQISLSGQRGVYGANVNVDGVDYNQPFFGGIRGGERSNTAFTVPQESIKEFQVVAGGYSAEFGRSTGGVINAVTKSGTNNWHGSLFYLLRPEKLARNNNYFDALQLSVQPLQTSTSSPPPFERKVRPAPRQDQFGGSIGGPIKKDKAFFFFSYEHQRFRNEREVFFNNLGGFTPTTNTQEAFDFFKSQETQFTATNDADALLGRFDYEINSNHRFNVRYSYSRNEALNSNATGNALFPTTVSALTNNGTEKDNTNTFVGQFASFFSTNLVNELRSQYSREERPRLSNSELPTVSTSIGRFGAVNFLPTTQFDWRFQVADSLTWTKGNHTVKFGGEINHIFVDQLFGFNQFGTFNISGSTVSTILDILSYTPSVTTGTVNRFDSSSVTYLSQIGNRQASYSTNEIAFFGQDAWRIRPNLTINYGLRWEGQYNPDPEANNTALINKLKDFRFPSGHVIDPTQIPDSTEQFGPRFGFAYDPSSDGKTVIRGYTGLYYARTPLLLLAAPFNNFRDPAGDLSIQLPLSTSSLAAGNPLKTCTTVYCQLKLIGVDLNTASLGSLPVISADKVRSIAQALGISGFDPFTGVAPIAMASDFKNPQSFQFGLGIERELRRGFTVGVDYTHVKTTYLQRNRDVNLPSPGLLAGDVSLRPFYGLLGSGTARPAVPRPISTLGSVQVRESTGKALYRALTLRAKFQKSRLQFNAFYTRSKSLSDDDNERDAGGISYENGRDLSSEYFLSRLDRKHQFVANPVFTTPFDFEISSAIRLLSGLPIDATFGSDANEDRGGPDRPFRAPGVPFLRNSFRNRPQYNVDLRVQKRFNLGAETRKLVVSAEIFNIFNLENIQLSGSQVTNYCATTTQRDCGFLAPSNPNFLSLYDLNPASSRRGSLLLTNNPGAPFQMQLGARFTF
ncbi:MAG: carboxypeptidase regulatory-like domain-containing protein [Acidobacteriota bacterium]